MSDSNSSDADPLGAIADEFVEAFRQGKRPSVEEYARRYPEHAGEIREMLPALVLMEKAKSGDDATGEAAKAADPVAVPSLRQLGDYQILREVGRGGMGVVYEAEQVSLGRRVALKVLPAQAVANERQRHRFEREARAAARLHHTNIVPVFGVGGQDGLYYYVMQFIQGLGLDEVLDELRRLRDPSAPAAPDSGGALRVSRRDVSAAAVAYSLVTGCHVVQDPPAAAGSAQVMQAAAGSPTPSACPTPRSRFRGARGRGKAGAAGPGPTGTASPASAPRSPTLCATPTRTASSTATSSPATSCSTPPARSGWRTSAWPRPATRPT
jgi:hypothetical protein